jgi:uncharacterized membrane protein
MIIYLLALLTGVVAGMRTMTPLAMVCWAACFDLLVLDGTWLAFLDTIWARWIFTALAIGELVADKLPSTPSRRAPAPFAARIVSGALCGAALATSPAGAMIGGALAGGVGAIIGTLAGYAFRARLAKSFGRDLPAALIEDAAAVAIVVLIVVALR